MIYPLHLNMLIRPTTNSVSPGGIHLAAPTVDGFQRGTIVEMGDGEHRVGCGYIDSTDDDTIIVTEGDEVYFTGGALITDPDTGETFVLVHYNNLVAMVSRDEAEEVKTPADIPAFGDFTDWIPWSGGECPVPDDAEVMAIFRDETGCDVEARTTAPAECYDWSHGRGDDDIVYYRII